VLGPLCVLVSGFIIPIKRKQKLMGSPVRIAKSKFALFYSQIKIFFVCLSDFFPRTVRTLFFPLHFLIKIVYPGGSLCLCPLGFMAGVGCRLLCVGVALFCYF